jgi:hypothetical protein
MKSTIVTLITATSLTLIFSSCKKNNIWGLTGKGNNITETRDVKGFDRIRLTTDSDVYYRQDSVFYIEVTGQKNILNALETKNESGNLLIGFSKNVWKHNKVKIVVHSPNIYGLSISGSGDIYSYNTINTSYMDLNISGSGDVTLQHLNTTSLDAKISGSGDIEVNDGTSTSQNLTVSGSGEMNLVRLTSTSSNCKISGSGDMEVNALENLDVNISGSGDIEYSGNPRVNVKISGSGKLSRI